MFFFVDVLGDEVKFVDVSVFGVGSVVFVIVLEYVWCGVVNFLCGMLKVVIVDLI